MIKTVYFDIGNVLVYFSPEKMFTQLSILTGLPSSHIQEQFYESPLREHYEKGKIDTQKLFEHFQNSSPCPFTLPEFEEAFSSIFTPNTSLFPLVESLKAKGVHLILLSNTSPAHFNYLSTHYPIFRLFDQKVLSYEIGFWKPDPQIFLHALSLSPHPPQNCLYIDDIPAFIQAANLQGLPSTLYTTTASLKKLLTV